MNQLHTFSSKSIASMMPDELIEVCSSIDEPKYKAEQIFLALHAKGVSDVDGISTLKKSSRETLSKQYSLPQITQKSVKISGDGTRKYQFETHDGHTIESVFIPNAAKQGRHSLCISSQVGCAMGCKFCATASLKLARNLDTFEIVSQVYKVMQDVKDNCSLESLQITKNEKPVHNIVFMGMGEPLHNFDNVVSAINLLTHHKGANFSPRRITVSTSGIVPKIKELGEKTKIYLAVSLNATTDATRSQIMPVNKKWNIETLVKACREFPLKVRERITFEYVMLKDLNDTPEDARRIIQLLSGLKCKINLIPFNEHPLSPFKTPDKKTVLSFHKILYEANLSVFTRKTRGDDIDAACGMLGAKKLESQRILRHNDA